MKLNIDWILMITWKLHFIWWKVGLKYMRRIYLFIIFIYIYSSSIKLNQKTAYTLHLNESEERTLYF